jgi:thiol:disulfide interchange protein
MKMRPLVPVLAGLALISMIAVAQKAPKTAGASWSKDLAKAQALAKKTGKMVLVDFNASWCGPCKLYKKEVFPTTEFKSATKDVILVEIDVDEQGPIASKFGISSIPDIRILNSNGKEVGRIVGYSGSKPLIAEIAKARKASKR